MCVRCLWRSDGQNTKPIFGFPSSLLCYGDRKTQRGTQIGLLRFDLLCRQISNLWFSVLVPPDHNSVFYTLGKMWYLYTCLEWRHRFSGCRMTSLIGCLPWLPVVDVVVFTAHGFYTSFLQFRNQIAEAKITDWKAIRLIGKYVDPFYLQFLIFRPFLFQCGRFLLCLQLPRQNRIS